MNTHYHFFLGGNDLEMEAIRRLLRYREVPPERIHDENPGWGAKASHYEKALGRLPKDAVPVLIELENDLALDERRVVILDHHGARAGIDKPTTLEQLWRLLEMPPERWGKGEFADFPLIAANDRGYIPALRRLGASRAKIADIRARDRAAQGITAEQERQAEAALESPRSPAGDALTLVDLPHDKTATVTDRLALDAPYRNLLVISPAEVNFFGEGALVCHLHKQFPGGWYGGELPENGYWGYATGEIEPGRVEQALCEALEQGVNRAGKPSK